MKMDKELMDLYLLSTPFPTTLEVLEEVWDISESKTLSELNSILTTTEKSVEITSELISTET